MATEYDPDILQKYADRLYRRAEWIALKYALYGFLFGIGAALVITLAFGLVRPRGGGGAPPVVWLLLIGFVLGLVYGWSRVFNLKVEAQRTLCQLQLERNTRALVRLAPDTRSEPPQQATCPRCAKSLPAGSRFCGYCGSPLTTAAPTAAPAGE